MSKREISSALSRDLSIYKYTGESDKEYYSRLSYSALGMWARFLASCADNSTKAEGNIHKGSHHRKLSEMLSRYQVIFDDLADYYQDDDPIALVRAPLFASRDLLEIGFDSRISIGDKANVDVDRFLSITIGDVGLCKGAFASGLACVSLSKRQDCTIPEFLSYWQVPQESASQILDNYIAHAKWDVFTVTQEFEFFDTHRQGPLSSCWIQACPIIETPSIIRKKPMFGKSEYYLVKRLNDVVYASKFSEFDQHDEIRVTQRLLYAMKASSRNKCVVNVDIYRQCSIWRFWSKLPPQEEKLLRYIGWPKNGITNRTREFVVRNEFNTLLTLISDNLGIIRKEIRHE